MSFAPSGCTTTTTSWLSRGELLLTETPLACASAALSTGDLGLIQGRCIRSVSGFLPNLLGRYQATFTWFCLCANLETGLALLHQISLGTSVVFVSSCIHGGVALDLFAWIALVMPGLQWLCGLPDDDGTMYCQSCPTS